jgi:hypothetical protein
MDRRGRRSRSRSRERGSEPRERSRGRARSRERDDGVGLSPYVRTLSSLPVAEDAWDERGELRAALDASFHRPHDPYPRGGDAHRELWCAPGVGFSVMALNGREGGTMAEQQRHCGVAMPEPSPRKPQVAREASWAHEWLCWTVAFAPPGLALDTYVHAVLTSHSLTHWDSGRGWVWRCTSSEFIPKLVRFRAHQAGARSSQLAPQPPDEAAAAALGLPASFHARYKSNNAVMLDAASPAMGTELVNEYRLMLVMFEDFVQKRDWARLVSEKRGS